MDFHRPGPSYLETHRNGHLKALAEGTRERSRSCDICPRSCGVDRLSGEIGYCGIGDKAVVSSYGPHPGEEGPISGRKGSGTIFFSGCNLGCRYCQNHDISQTATGQVMGDRELASAMVRLQDIGCHNINLVSPTHVVPQILSALPLAVESGLQVPIVYNTGGYDSIDTLRCLEGVVDIYMPDMKYSDPGYGEFYSLVPDYPRVNRSAVREMHRQVGDLMLDERKIAVRGLLVRHLILPNDVSGTGRVLEFISQELSRDTYVNLMRQYGPCYDILDDPLLNRRIETFEFERAEELAFKLGLWRLDHLM